MALFSSLDILSYYCLVSSSVLEHVQVDYWCIWVLVGILLTWCLTTQTDTVPHIPKQTSFRKQSATSWTPDSNWVKLLQNFQLVALEWPRNTKLSAECHSRFQWMHMVLHKSKQVTYARSHCTPMPCQYFDVWVQNAYLHTWQTRGSLCLKETKNKRKINRNKSLVCYLQTTNHIYTMRQTLKTEI